MEMKVDIDKRSHALDILEQLNNFRKNNKHCDFIIKAGKEERPVHRYVVSACSEYFDAMLTHDTKENRDGVVEIKNVDSECVMKCVDFMYTGEASVSDEKQGDLMHVAHMLRLHRLYNGVALFLEKKLDCQSFFSTREIANTYDCKKLTEFCNEFALKNFRDLAQVEGFKTLEDGYLSFLLSSEDLKVSEWVKCKAVMVWVNHDSSRASSLFSMIKHIDFMTVPMSYRRFLIDNEPIFALSFECYKVVVKTMLDADKVEAKDVSLDINPDSGIIAFDSTNVMLKRLDMGNKTWSELQATRVLQNQTYSAVILNGYLYAFLSNQATFRIKFEDGNAAWERMANCNGNYGPAIALNGSIYMTSYGTFFNKLERYDPTSNQWSVTPSRAQNARLSSLAVAGVNGFKFCSCDSEISSKIPKNAPGDVRAVRILDNEPVHRIEDTLTSSYGKIKTLFLPQYNINELYSQWTQGKLFVIGGFSASGRSVNYVERFDPVTSSWCNSTYLKQERYLPSAATLDDTIYVFGGLFRNNGSGHVTSIEIFRQNSNSWELVKMSNLNRHSFNTISFDGMLYLVGGESNDPRTIYQFDPHTKKLTKTLKFDFDIIGYASVAVTS